ncbi:MAG: insulinase family protein [Nitrospirota bacterium]|nr:insulinase family protein [Nitrospirota bacterium]
MQRHTLDNGMVIQVVERKALPIISVELALPDAGAIQDPREQAGMAALTARLLTEGTATRSADQIAEAIEYVGASLEAGAGPDFATVSFTGLSRDLSLGLELMADVTRHPKFAEDDVTRIRDEVLADIQAGDDKPGVVAAKAFDKALFGAHPYALPEEGTEDTVPGLGPEQLMAFHSRYYVPEGAVISLVGDVSMGKAKKLVKAHFGGWSGARPAPQERAAAVPPEGIRLITVDRPVTQANVAMGHLGLTRSDPDYYPVIVMNYLLGGGALTSRLGDSVRDSQGLAYSIYSAFAGMGDPGSFAVRFQTRNESANQAIRSVLAELRRIREEKVPQEELDAAKSYLTGSFPLRLDTNNKTVGLLTFIRMYGLGDSYFTDYLERVRQVTARDVQRVARQYLHPDDMVWVVVANQGEANVERP